MSAKEMAALSRSHREQENGEHPCEHISTICPAIFIVNSWQFCFVAKTVNFFVSALLCLCPCLAGMPTRHAPPASMHLANAAKLDDLDHVHELHVMLMHTFNVHQGGNFHPKKSYSEANRSNKHYNLQRSRTTPARNTMNLLIIPRLSTSPAFHHPLLSP